MEQSTSQEGKSNLDDSAYVVLTRRAKIHTHTHTLTSIYNIGEEKKKKKKKIEFNFKRGT